MNPRLNVSNTRGELSKRSHKRKPRNRVETRHVPRTSQEKQRSENGRGKGFVNTVRERKYKVRMKPFNTRSPGCSNRIAKKRGTDKVKDVLPATPSKKAAIIKTIVNSPRTRTILEDEGMMKTLTDEMETRALKALASDISDGLQDVKKARSNKKRAAFTAFKSLAFGKNVKKAKVKKSLSKIVNIDEKSIRKAIQRRQKVLKGDLPSWQYTT